MTTLQTTRSPARLGSAQGIVGGIVRIAPTRASVPQECAKRPVERESARKPVSMNAGRLQDRWGKPHQEPHSRGVVGRHG